MALVSPGISISINDQSQYVNNNIGSVPLVILATAQDKTYNSSTTAGTSKAMAGQLLAFTSQRDLVTQMGTPTFQLSSAGTPVNGSEINEYGLMAAYSALGLTNQLYAIRADIDLNQLTGTSVRPIGAPSSGTYWLDTVNTQWGLFSLNATTNSFSAITPLIIRNPAQVQNDNTFPYDVPTPIPSVGQVGQYALVFVDPSTNEDPSVIRLFYKAGAACYPSTLNNTWVQVGSPTWQNCTPVVTGTLQNPTLTAGSTLYINNSGSPISLTGGTTIANLAASINSASIPGVTAAVVNGYLTFFITSAAKSNGSVADGKLILTDGTHTPLATCGISTAISYYAPILFYGNYAQTPSFTNGQNGWYSTDNSPRPTGSIWWKTTSTGGGFNAVLTQYNSTLDSFQTLTTAAFSSPQQAIAAIDPTGGGANIQNGQTIALYNVTDTTYNSLTFSAQQPATVTTATGGIITGTTPFTAGNTFTLSATQPGSSNLTTYTITLSTTSVTGFVSDLLSQNIPYVTATLNSNNTITIIHTTGGYISLSNGTGTPLTTAGFTSGVGSGFTINTNTTPAQIIISNFTGITGSINYSASQPYSKPATGTYWYYSNPADVDVMINDGGGWKGYKTVSSDARGYNLQNTDANGVIISSIAPVSQSTGSALVAGDLWLNSSDLVNYPNLSRYNGSTWVTIDNTDHVTSGGIIFADARWDGTGTTDIISGSFSSTVSLLTSSYIDQDAPDYRLYARGTLLFNTRRSGYNVKKYIPNYFNSSSFPSLPAVPGAASSLPSVTDAWVTASGLNTKGVMQAGSAAQRAIVVGALQSAVDSNLDILSPNYQFNLIVAPGYPELIPNMITLNDNRGDTAFIIGDTPMDLAPNTVDINTWVSNTNGNGLSQDASATPYLALYYPAGQTNDLAGNQIVVPASHAVLRTFLYSDQVSYPWFAPAGVNRGHVSNLSDIGYINSSTGQFVHNGISQGLRDALFTLNINPITQLPGTGLVIWGQITRSGATTARNRVNVVRLENYLRTIFNSIANGYLFEPNDGVTRKSIASQIEGALNNILAHRGLYDFLVICDTSNNTPSTIANNQLYVDVAIEPMRDVEFIYIPIAIYNPGSIASLNTTST